MKVSIIIPVLNEASGISGIIESLRTTLRGDFEIIVVDGGSVDGCIEKIRYHVDLMLTSASGRARQMNSGAARARGDIFLFLHADTTLPTDAINDITATKMSWGYFEVRLSGSHLLFRIIEYMMNLRSRLTSVATGDQVLFVTRELFESVGGFPQIELMEDVAMSKLLRRHSRPLRLKKYVVTSSRRWQNNGIFKTITLMWWMRLLYFLGVAPSRLARMYYRS